MEHWEYEGSEILGIYANQKDAEAEATKLSNDDTVSRRCSFQVHQYEVK